MKTLRPILIVLIVAGVAWGGWTIYQEIRGLKTDLKAIDAAAKTTIADQQKQIVALVASNAKLAERDAQAEVEKAELRASLAAKQSENDRLREDLKTAPPETVLAKTKTWLSTQEIWLRANAAAQTEAVFSLAAFRLNADALADREFMKFTLIPSIQAQLKLSEEQSAGRAATISNQTLIIAHKDVILAEKDKQIVGRDETIKALKKGRFWRTLAYIGGAFALGYIAHIH